MLGAALTTEALKLRRARITWVLPLVYAFAPLMLGLMMSVLMHPELGRRLGLLTVKAQLTVPATNWSTYLMLTGELFAGGLIVLSVIEAFVFGREYVEGTAKTMLTLPVARTTLIAAKLTVSAAWFLVVAGAVYAEALVVGLAIGLPGLRPGLLAASAGHVGLLLVEVFLAGGGAALLAVASRGYLAPVGIGVLLLLIGDLFAQTGWGSWIPWAIVFVDAASGPFGKAVGIGSFAVLVGYFMLMASAAWVWMDRSDTAG